METRVAVGVGAVFVVLFAAVQAPSFVGGALVGFSIVAFAWAVVGLIRPEWGRLPNRLASVWVWMVSVGLLIGGGVMIAPQAGVVSSDAPVAEQEPEERSAVNAQVLCMREVERVGVYEHRWLVGVFGGLRFAGTREVGDVLTLVGDQIEYQTEGGAWFRATYECDYDFGAEEIVDVRVVPGRM